MNCGIFKNDNIDLMQIWDKALCEVNLPEEEKNFSKQTIYAIRSISIDSHIQTSEDFWNDEKLPFLFFTIMQLSKIDSCAHFRKCIEEQVKEVYCNEYGINMQNIDNNMRIITYFTLESNSLILAIKSKNFIKGETIINSLHGNNTIISYKTENGCEKIAKIYNTYTLNAINNKILINKKYEKITGKVKDVYLFIIEKIPGSIQRLTKAIQERIGDDTVIVHRKMLSGNDDECLIIKEIEWKKLLSLYAPMENAEPGLLTSGNAIFNETMYSVATYFMIAPNLKSYFKKMSKFTRKSLKKTNLTKNIYDCIKCAESFLKPEDGKKQYVSTTYCKALRQAINAIQKFEISVFPDYIFFWMFKSLKLISEAIMFSACLEWALVNEFNDEQIKLVRFCINQEAVFDFLKGIVLIAQNSMHSDRQFMQVPDFNAKLYDVPVKLNALYAAIINKVCKILNRSNHEYSFLLVPGLNEYLVVKTVFDRFIKSKRLFTIEIPERQMFELQYTIPSLIHEIAHKVGGDLRKREIRYDYIKTIIIHILTHDIMKMYGIGLSDKDCYKKIYPEIKRIFCGSLDKCRNDNNIKYDNIRRKFNEIRADYLSNFEIDFSERDYNRGTYLKEDIEAAVNDFINKIQTNTIFLKILWAQKQSYDVCHNYSRHVENEIVATEKFIRLLSTYNEKEKIVLEQKDFIYGFRVSLYYMFYLFSEVYADCVSILLLKISEETYFDSINSNVFALEKKNLYGSIAVFRMALVMRTMMKQPKDYKWNGKYISSQSNDDIFGKTAKSIMGLILKWNNPDGNQEQIVFEDIPKALHNPQIYELYTQYINECITILYGILNNNNDLVKNLREVYHNVIKGKGSIEELIEFIESSINDYRDQIL